MTQPAERALTWSFGGGTQSVAIAVLVAEGKLPVPERIVIANTNYEASETWEYMDRYVQPLLASVDREVEIAPRTLATTEGLRGKNGDLLLPVFTSGGGKLPTLCSNEWKKRVVSRWLRQRGYGPSNPVRMWIGISVDEVHRAKPSGVAWQEYHWPLLLDIPTRRHECRLIVENAGLPAPPRSSCWMCPHRNNEEWTHLRDNYPKDWRRAVRVDREVRAADEKGGVFLHRSMLPLDDVPIDAPTDQADMFDGCDSGFCFV